MPSQISQFARHYGIYIFAALSALGMAYLLTNAFFEKGMATPDRCIFIFIAIAAIYFLYKYTFPAGFSKENWEGTTDLAKLGNATLTWFGVLTAALGIMAPRPSIESQPGILESTVKTGFKNISKGIAEINSGNKKIIDLFDVNGSDDKIKYINGHWGEPNCQVVYEARISANSLTINTVRLQPGMDHRKWVFKIINREFSMSPNQDNKTILYTQQKVGFPPHSATDFIYSKVGDTEELTWKSYNEQQPTVDMMRCEGSMS